MKNEVWKDVIGYEGHYRVSDSGKVASIKVGYRLLSLRSTTTYGYIKVSLHKDGVRKTANVHQLVADAFLGPRPEGTETRHGEGGRQDNSVPNLSYGTPSENQFDRYRDGSMGGIQVLRDDGCLFPTYAEAGRVTGIPYQNIIECSRGLRPTAGGFTWKEIKCV